MRKAVATASPTIKIFLTAHLVLFIDAVHGHLLLTVIGLDRGLESTGSETECVLLAVPVRVAHEAQEESKFDDDVQSVRRSRIIHWALEPSRSVRLCHF